MSLDGGFLHIVKTELINKNLIGARVDKIYQPSREEIVVSLRTGGGTEKLMLSASIMSARVCLTETALENPKAPPMFCMLLRKHLGGGRLTDITQDGLERILNFDFLCMNEIGDMVTNRLVIEIMGRASNILLLTQKEGIWRVIDSAKRVTDEVSSVRRILPNIVYELPPRERRLSLLDYSREDTERALSGYQNEKLNKALLKIFEGVSPILTREAAFYTARDTDLAVSDLNPDRLERLNFFLHSAQRALNGEYKPTVIKKKSGELKDFCYIPIEQYGTGMVTVAFPSANALLDGYFDGKAGADRLKQRSGDLLKMLMNTYERISRKIELQKQELSECNERERFRVSGDLLNANLYRMEKGQNKITVDNYYSGEKETIKLDVMLTPVQNAQKYYSEYKKLDNAEKMLTKLIKSGEKELIYIDSVFDEVSRTSGESELAEIREELIETGYLRRTRKGGKSEKIPKAAPPMKFTSSDGFEILVGRNNVQNDRLTLKTAKPDDLWLHTQKIAGSHTIISADGREIPDSTIVEAATLAAYCSKAQKSTKVPVDYTRVRFVKKPNGAKPGMVIFTNNKTILVDPDEELFKKLRS